MVVSGLDQAEQLLLGGELPCPHCEGVLRPFGHGRSRIVRGLGLGQADRDTPPGQVRRLRADPDPATDRADRQHPEIRKDVAAARPGSAGRRRRCRHADGAEHRRA